MRILSSALVLSIVLAMPFARTSAVRADEHEHKAMFDKCAKACNDCQRACDSCATHCLDMVAKGHKAHQKTLRTCLDCSQFCATAAQIVSRGGPFSDLICTSCAEACARCGKACEEFPDSKHMKMCAEECRRCETACREMIKHAKHIQAAN